MEKVDTNRSLTRSEFCYVENMSPTKYHGLKKFIDENGAAPAYG
jgi:hypothetical protein